MPRQVLEERDDLSILAAAVKAAGLDDTLDDEKAVLTVFAPVDDGPRCAMFCTAMWFLSYLCAHAAFVELLDRLKMTKEQLLENKARVLSFPLSRILHCVADTG
jgi:hypothetical protein